MSLLPSADGLELIHTRNYETRVYVLDESTVLARGVVSDVKPPGLYVDNDPDELEIHQMHVFLKVAVPSMEIIDAGLEFETHPHSACTGIVDHYRSLIGLSIARGFTHKVREQFGGPRGCTHSTALLQAMAPAVVQSIWSLGIRRGPTGEAPDPERVAADHQRRLQGNLNTCHVWAEDGVHIEMIRRGEKTETLKPVAERLVALGRDPGEWDRRMGRG